jgi:DNA modification methylase
MEFQNLINIQNTIELEKIKLNNLYLQESLPSKIVNISDKNRSNLLTWRGQFSPQLISALISNYAKKNDVVLDPFVGSGTVLFECAYCGLECYGIELNPAAFGLASLYKLINLEMIEREKSIYIIDNFTQEYLREKNLFEQRPNKPLNLLKSELVEQLKIYQKTNTGLIINALIIGLDFEQTKLDTKRLHTVWLDLKNKIRQLPYSQIPINLFWGDARQTSLEDSMIDLVITSPPYINVFNYHQNYRKSVEAIGYDILEIAKSEIGSNRKFRGNRYLIVAQYILDMFLVFQELKRVCKSNAKIIFIVGRESSVCKTPFFNAKIIAEVAVESGFILEGQQPRVFTNKFGQKIYEEILRFSINNQADNQTIEIAKKIAIKYLNESLKIAPEQSICDLKEAIKKANQIKPSLIFSRKNEFTYTPSR